MSKKSAEPSDVDPVSRFEADLKALEAIVAKMESGDLPLEESLALFERGVALTRACRDALERAELRISKLLAETKPPAREDETP